ncbi:hypothetical protein [Cognatilysobacter lacus]|uniref:Secreted protein n=1 Tax=Cognatilysobacter lacus TaxID=1643323 RepID=A0A5D8ZA41_9GAMM|nr:hypothetical protein [Lysobacter lacus]TZF91436.1 hypothetical protein FW784_01775 [Lysobacter lacus]
MTRLLRKRSAALLLAASLGATTLAHAQGASGSGPHSGDAWVDGRLVDIGAYASTYRESFVDELARYHRAPRPLVAELLARPGWTPGDVYFACSLAMQAGRPCREVAEMHSAEPVRDWASVAASLGVSAGTPAFHRIKRDIVASYQRWARPVSVDDELAPDFPQRARATGGHPAKQASQIPPAG